MVIVATTITIEDDHCHIDHERGAGGRAGRRAGGVADLGRVCGTGARDRRADRLRTCRRGAVEITRWGWSGCGRLGRSVLATDGQAGTGGFTMAIDTFIAYVGVYDNASDADADYQL